MKSSMPHFYVLSLLIFLFSCTSSTIDITPLECSIEQEIIIDQDVSTGTMNIWNDGTYLYIQYNLTDNWYLQQSQIFITDCNQTKNIDKLNPKLVKSYIQTFPTPSTTQEYTEIIPLKELKNCFCIIFKSTIVEIEEEIGVEYIFNQVASLDKNNEIPTFDSNWNWTTEYCVKKCVPKDKPQPEDNEETCETAYAGPETGSEGCFINTGLFTRWGWRLELTKTDLAEGSQTFPIWAGAGQCDQNKGSHVGDLNVSYNSTTEEVTITTTMLSGFALDESHVWVGDDSNPWPKNSSGSETVAPGSYGNQHDLTDATTDNYTLDVSQLADNFYLIYHSVSCDFEDGGNTGEEF